MKRTVSSNTIRIRDLAEEMNVAVSTVSRALSGDPGVSAQKAQVIRKVARDMGYRPSPLRRKIKQAIGMIISTDASELVMDRYQKTVLFHTERLVSQKGLHLHVQFMPREEEEGFWPAALKENRVDGLLITGHPHADLCHQLAQQGVPAVIINDTVERTHCSCVLADPTTATTEAVRRLTELGHRHIGMVITDRQFPTIERRYQAYYFAMFDAGIKPDPSWLVQDVPANLTGGRLAVRRFIEGGKLPTAIVFANDWLALGGILELLEQGLQVPRDVSVVGHDNDPICEELSPCLSSCDMCIEETVTAGLQLLEKQINSKENDRPEEITLSGHLVWRESCARARTQE